MSTQPAPKPWRSRIVGHADVAPDQLLANPANWRCHPKYQQDALAGILDQVGFVQAVIVNVTTQHVVDGHLRVSLAISRNEPTIPVTYVELTLAEEQLVLATFDPIAAQATTDMEKQKTLLAMVEADDQAVKDLIAKLNEANTGEVVNFEVQDRPCCPTCGQKLKKGQTIQNPQETT